MLLSVQTFIEPDAAMVLVPNVLTGPGTDYRDQLYMLLVPGHPYPYHVTTEELSRVIRWPAR